MRLGHPLQYSGDPRRAADHVADLEQAGLDVVWVAEAYGFDSPTLMGYLAAVTERVRIGSAILPIYSRTPALIAQTAAGLDNVSGGRAILGLGASGPQVIEGWHGVPFDRPVTRTREIIDLCRRIWRRETVTNDGIYRLPLPEEEGRGLGKPLKLLTEPERDRIPIHVASLGPNNVEMTAELADGWLPIFFLPEHVDEVWGDALEAGGAARDEALDPLEIAAGNMLAITEDEDEARRMRDLARPTVALYVGGMGSREANFYNDLFRRFGYGQAAAEIQNLYLDGHKDDAAAAVPDDALRKMTLVGPPGHVRERIAAHREAGVSILNVIPVADDPVELIATVKAWIS